MRVYFISASSKLNGEGRGLNPLTVPMVRARRLCLLHTEENENNSVRVLVYVSTTCQEWPYSSPQGYIGDSG